MLTSELKPASPTPGIDVPEASHTKEVEEPPGSGEENDYLYNAAVREAIATRRWDVFAPAVKRHVLRYRNVDRVASQKNRPIAHPGFHHLESKAQE